MVNRCLVALALALLLPAAAIGVPPEEFDAAVDFNASIRSLYESMQRDPEGTIDTQRSVILNGIVASVTIVDPAEESFQAFIELVTGQWQGLENVELYRTYIRVTGPQYFNRLPTRQNREPSGDLIEQNSRVLVAGNIIGYLPDQMSDAIIPAVDGFHIRTLE